MANELDRSTDPNALLSISRSGEDMSTDGYYPTDYDTFKRQLEAEKAKEAGLSAAAPPQQESAVSAAAPQQQSLADQLRGMERGEIVRDPQVWHDLGMQFPGEKSTTIGKGFKGGIESTIGLGYGAGAMIADYFGAEDLKSKAIAGYERQMELASLYNQNIPDFTDIENGKDVLDWTLYYTGNLAPTMLTMMAGGGFGGMIANIGGKKAIQAMMADQLAKGVSKEVAAKYVGSELAKQAVKQQVGAALGAGAVSVGLESGSIYGETKDKEVAAIHGLIAGSLDALPVILLLKKFGIGKAASDAIKKSIPVEMAKQALYEGGTEGLQTVIEQHAKYWVDNNGESLLNNLGAANWKEVVNATMAGVLGGTVFGGAGALYERGLDRPQPAQIPPGQTPPGQTPPGQTPPGQTPPGQTPPGQAPTTKTADDLAFEEALKAQGIKTVQPGQFQSLFPESATGPVGLGPMPQQAPVNLPIPEVQQPPESKQDPESLLWFIKPEYRVKIRPEIIAAIENGEITDFDTINQLALEGKLTIPDEEPPADGGDGLPTRYPEAATGPVGTGEMPENVAVNQPMPPKEEQKVPRETPASWEPKPGEMPQDFSVDQPLPRKINGDPDALFKTLKDAGINSIKAKDGVVVPTALVQQAHDVLKKQQEEAPQAISDESIKARLKEGIKPTFEELDYLNVHWFTNFSELAPLAQRLFGLEKHEVAKALGKPQWGNSTTDGANYLADDALVNAAKYKRPPALPAPEGYEWAHPGLERISHKWFLKKDNQAATNAYDTQEEALNQLFRDQDQQEEWARQERVQQHKEAQIKEKLLAGKDLVDGDFGTLDLGTAAPFSQLSKTVQRLFGIKRNKVREAMGDGLYQRTSDMGTKSWWGHTNKALKNAASWLNAQNQPIEEQTDETPTETRIQQQQEEGLQEGQEEVVHPEWATQHEKDVSGRIVYSDDALGVGLLEGFSVVTGRPVYAAVLKNGNRTLVDIESYTGDQLTDVQKQALITAKQKYVAADQQRHEANPDGPFTKGNNVATSSNFPADLASTTKEWLAMLGITDRVYLTTPEDAKLPSEAKTKNLYGPYAAIRSAGIDGNEGGSTRRLANGDHYISVRLKPRGSQNLETLAHEIGHILEKTAWDAENVETKNAIIREYNNWVSKAHKTKAKDWVKSLRAHVSGKLTTITNENQLASEIPPYWRSFSEWFADQVSRWAVSDAKPLTVVEKFFARIAAGLKRLYASAAGKASLPTQVMRDYLNARSPLLTDFSKEPTDDTRTEAGTAGVPEIRGEGGNLESLSETTPVGELETGQPGVLGGTEGEQDATPAGLGMPSEDGGGDGRSDAGGYGLSGRETDRGGRSPDDGTGEPVVTPAGTGGATVSGGISGPAEGSVSPANPGPGNYHIDNPLEIVGGGQVARFNKNKAAIELYTQLQDEGRPATKEEQAILAGYTGWGSFGQELFQGTWSNPKPKEGWQARDEWLRETIGQKEWESMQRSITNAHYTDPPTVLAMWNMVQRMGFTQGRILEPSMGIGNFFGMMPLDIKNRSMLAGIELDEITGGMAKLIYPDANIHIKGYQDSKTPDGFYDLIIGNWPFENTVVADRRYMQINPFLHDYFFLKAVDQVRAGGLVVGITSKGTLDKVNNKVRVELAKKAELVAAFRLPSGAFKDYAGTAVVTDIIILKKRDKPTGIVAREGWIDSIPYKTPQGEIVKVNEYYLNNPQNVVGTIDYGHGTTFARPGMIVHRPDDMMGELARITARVPEGVYSDRIERDPITYIANHTDDRQNALIETPDGFFVVRGEYLAPANSVKKYELTNAKKQQKREQELRDIIALRKAYGALLDADLTDTEKGERKALRKAYDKFVKDHGRLSDSFSLKYLKSLNDPFFPSLASLEIKTVNDNGKTTYHTAAIMDASTMRGALDIKNPSIEDAFVLARNRHVSPTLEQIATLANKSEADTKAVLIKKGAVFELPDGDIVPSDMYLSGNVRIKYRQAQQAVAAGQTHLQRNVDALEKVLPKDIPYYQIEVQMGATYVSPSVYEQYVSSLLGMKNTQGIKITYQSGRWSVVLDKQLNRRTEANTNFGTTHVPFSRLINAALSNQSITVRYKDWEGNSVVDGEATKEVNEKISNIRERFGDWLWSEPNRRVAVEKEYNETRNAFADPQFDGSFLGFQGMALNFGKGAFELREHQVNAIWRGLVTRKSLNAHEVGTGKTFTMGGIAVESRRYGLAKKPLLFAHNANSASVAAEIQQMYPGAKVLYIDNMDKNMIAMRMQQIASDDWDVIIVPHSLINNFGMKEATLMDMAKEEIDEIMNAAEEAAAEDGVTITADMLDESNEKELNKLRSRTAKELVKMRNRIINNIKTQALKASKEGAIAFEDMGVDMILVDEAHEFKKPPFGTKMEMKGLQKEASVKSIALNFLTTYVRANNYGGNVHLFTGTPITNTLTEVFHMMRYIMKEDMQQYGVDQWDGWFGSFASEVNDVELQPTGEYKAVIRLAAFINVPELRRMLGQYMDVVFADSMPEMQPRKTTSGKTLADTLSKEEAEELLNGRTENAEDRPYKKVFNESTDLTQDQLDEFERLQALGHRWENMTGRERFEAIRSGAEVVPITRERLANKASFDVRLLNAVENVGQEGKLPDDPNSKASRAIANILEIYHSDPQANQAIFSDIGLGKFATVDGIAYPAFSTIWDMVERLKQAGIPAEQIAVVDLNTSKQKRKEIADAMNENRIRIVFGSSKSLGVGVNMQKNLRAMHHLDAPYMPGDLEQRNGRGHRQRNQWNTVLEFRYQTDRLDGRRWQILAIKQRFIMAFMKAKGDNRVIEGDAASDEESDILESFSSAAGDPRILIREKLKKKLEKLQSKENLHTRAVVDAQQTAEYGKRNNQSLKNTLKRLIDNNIQEKVQAAVQANAGDKFSVVIDKKTYTTRKDANEAIEQYLLKHARRDQTITLGEYGGHELTLAFYKDRQPHIGLTLDIGDGLSEFLEGTSSTIASLEATLRNYRRVDTLAKTIEENEAVIERLEQAALEPFHRADELAKVEQELEALEADISMNPDPAPFWLRNGAPVETLVYKNGKEYVVTGHKWTETGWYVLGSDENGDIQVINYEDAKDAQGMRLYEQREFVSPSGVKAVPEPEKVITPLQAFLSGANIPYSPVEGGVPPRAAPYGINFSKNAISAMPERITVGPVSFKPTPLGNMTLYRETNLAGLDDVMRETFSNNVERGDVSRRFVTDDRDLAIGQGTNKGVLIEMDGNLVSGEEHVKPGTGIVGGREYTTNYINVDAIQRITITGNPTLRGLTHTYLNKFFNRIQQDNALVFTRKKDQPTARIDAIKIESDPEMADALNKEMIARAIQSGEPVFSNASGNTVYTVAPSGNQWQVTTWNQMGQSSTTSYNNLGTLINANYPAFQSLYPGQTVTPPTTPPPAGGGTPPTTPPPFVGPVMPPSPPTPNNRAVRESVRDRIDAIRFYMQDKLIDLKNYQRDLNVQERADAYQKASLWDSKAGERINDFDERHVQPLLQKVAETGLTLEEVDWWLVARHAEEANAYLAEINPDYDTMFPNAAPNDRFELSGMSDTEARAILNLHANNQALQEVGRLVDVFNRARVTMLVNEGLIGQDMADAWQGRYQHYVPLQRQEFEGEELLPGRGAGFNIRGKESKRRLGSLDKPVHQLANMIEQFEKSIIRAEKNKVGNALLQLVKDHPDGDFWHIDYDRSEKAFQASQVNPPGKVVKKPIFMLADNEFSTKIKGKEFVIAFNRKNPQAMRLVKGLKNLGAAEMGWALRKMSALTRFLSQINTTWNPEFFITNFARDIQTALYNVSSTELAHMKRQVFKSVGPAIRGIHSALFGDGSHPWAQIWEEFRAQGAKTGWIDLHKDVLEKERDLKKSIKRLQSGKDIKSNWSKLLEGVDNLNQIFENATRLAAYGVAIKPIAQGGAGLSKEKAAALAKDLTVNFNRKGFHGSTMNSLYMFYNAGVQGNVRLLQGMAKSKQGRRLAYATVGFAIFLDMLNRANAGDDDDGQNRYDTLPNSIKDHNIIFMGEKGPIAKLAAPWGFNTLHTLGQVIGKAIDSVLNGTPFKPLDEAARILTAAFDAFNPLGSGTVAQIISPTISDPIVMIAENKNFMGTPLKPEHTYDSRTPKPEYQMHFSGAREMSKWIAEALNTIGGGTELRPSELTVMNVSPEWIDLIIDYFTGGAGRTAANTADFLQTIVTGEELKADRIPFARKVTGYNYDYGVKSRYYEWAKDVAYAKAERKQKLPTTKATGLIWIYDATEKKLQVLRKKRQHLVSTGASKDYIQQVDDEIRVAMSKFNRAYANTMFK